MPNRIIKILTHVFRPLLTTFILACFPFVSLANDDQQEALPLKEGVMAQMEKVANWQIARTQHMTNVGRARRNLDWLCGERP